MGAREYQFAQNSLPERSTSPKNTSPLCPTTAPENTTTDPLPKPKEIRKRTHDVLIPARLAGKSSGVLRGFKSILCSPWLGILCICIPVAWVIQWALPKSNTNKYILNFTMADPVLSNLLLVLVISFFVGGLRQAFGVSANLNTTLLKISVIAVLLPATFHFSVTHQPLADPQEAHNILAISHSVVVMLLFIYAGYLAFKLHSSPKFGPHRAHVELEEKETPQFSSWTIIGLLFAVAVLMVMTAEWLVKSIDGITSSGHINAEFVGVILLQIGGNATEHVTMVNVSVRDGLDLRLGVALGYGIQMLPFIIP